MNEMDKVRFPLAQAEAVANELIILLQPACERITVAGSIRSRRPEVSDIELLAIPRANYLEKMLSDLMMQNILAMRLNRRGSRTYGPKNKLMVHLPSGMAVDIFSATEENWGMALFFRTGPREWNIKAMSRFRQLGMQGHAYGGVTLPSRINFECPTEAIVFNLLRWPYTPPEKR